MTEYRHEFQETPSAQLVKYYGVTIEFRHLPGWKKDSLVEMLDYYDFDYTILNVKEE